MNRRQFLAATAGAVGSGLLRDGGVDAAAEAQEKRPLNVLFIMTDQQFGGCVGYAGHPYVQTPHLDALARDGVVFDNAYCAYPVCTASRCSLLTGTWPHTHNCNLNVGAPETNAALGLPPDTVMTESLLFDRGYTTKHRGKWHCGDQRRHACYQADDAYRYLHGYGEHVRKVCPPHSLGAPEGQAQLHGYPLYMTPEVERAHRLFHEHKWSQGQEVTLIGRTPIPADRMEDSWVFDECIDLLDKYQDEPFMITCSVSPPHAWWVAPDPYYSMYDPAKLALPDNQTRPAYYKNSIGVRMFDSLGEAGVKEFLRCYYAQVSLVDANVGRIMKKLKETGQYDHTLVIFTSDHGDMNGAHRMVSKAVTPAQYEETARVPLVMSCPGLLPKGRRVRTMANGVDVMPTILDYAGVPVPGRVQGASLRPFIEGVEDLERPAFTEGTHPRAQHVARRIRTQEWRYYFSYQNWSTKGERFEYNVPLELFHIAEDPGEERNLASDPKYRDVLRRLDTQLRDHLRTTGDDWAAQLPAIDV